MRDAGKSTKKTRLMVSHISEAVQSTAIEASVRADHEK